MQWRDEGGQVVKQTVGGSIELIECCTKWTFGTFSSFHYFLCNEVMGVDYGRGEGDGWEGSGGSLLGRRPGARWDVD